MSRHVFRSVIPVSDHWHLLDLSGPIVHVATRGEDYVELWHLDDTDVTREPRSFRVVGTGHSLAPALAIHIGTAITPSGRYVWHVFEHGKGDS